MTFLGYIDPGAGSLIIQALIGTALAVPFLLRRRLRGLLDRIRPASARDGEREVKR